MITLPKLPYDFSDFAPDISAQTMTFHYTKHHMGYVQKTNDLIKNTPFDDKPLSHIVLTSASDSRFTTLFNNAAQAWNHDFFWQSITPQKTIPTKLLSLINKNFQDLTSFFAQFSEKGLSQFASGWLWLVATPAQDLQIITTSNANTPLTDGNLTPLLCLDLWEHAYYLDYQNRRADYLNTLITNHLNWPFAESNFSNHFSKTN